MTTGHPLRHKSAQYGYRYPRSASDDCNLTIQEFRAYSTPTFLGRDGRNLRNKLFHEIALSLIGANQRAQCEVGNDKFLHPGFLVGSNNIPYLINAADDGPVGRGRPPHAFQIVFVIRQKKQARLRNALLTKDPCQPSHNAGPVSSFCESGYRRYPRRSIRQRTFAAIF